MGDITRTRLSHIRALFFAGLNDGVVPKASGGGGILSDLERQKLREMDVELPDEGQAASAAAKVAAGAGGDGCAGQSPDAGGTAS